jgi:hypothetical protein
MSARKKKEILTPEKKASANQKMDSHLQEESQSNTQRLDKNLRDKSGAKFPPKTNPTTPEQR